MFIPDFIKDKERLNLHLSSLDIIELKKQIEEQYGEQREPSEEELYNYLKKKLFTDWIPNDRWDYVEDYFNDMIFKKL